LGKNPKSPSLFSTEFDNAIERWARLLPSQARESFRAEFQRFAVRYETAFDTLEDIWERRERAYAFDEFTGLATRGPFYDYLTALLDGPPSLGLNAVGVLFIDIDDLKRINDTCGHHAGDRAISAVSAILREAVRVERQVDSVARIWDDSYSIGRHGGDEFVAALQLSDVGEIDHVAPRVKHRADDPDRQRARGYPGPVSLSVSVGGVVYELPRTGSPVAPNALATALLSAADALMYDAKRDGLIHVARARFTDRLEVEHPRRIQVSAG
jgi:diguanylate cyclase (GGDEF)-like protein